MSFKKTFLLFIYLLFILPPVTLGLLYLSHDVSALKNSYPKLTLNGEQREYLFQKKKPRYWVSINEISTYAKWAIVISEDWAFYDHAGLDYRQLKKVITESIQERHLTRGASTISQQLVKNIFLSHKRSIFRKLHEVILTFKLEQTIPKDKILEAYLNSIEFGDKLYGIKKASYFYFKKHPRQLNPKEAAFLAMLLPSPKRYAESFQKKKLTEYANSKINRLLNKLRIVKIITHEEMEYFQNTYRLSFEEVVTDPFIGY